MEKKGEWLCAVSTARQAAASYVTTKQQSKRERFRSPFAQYLPVVSGLVVAGAPDDRQQDKQHQHQGKIVKKTAIKQTTHYASPPLSATTHTV
jgi:hypothetical protein